MIIQKFTSVYYIISIYLKSMLFVNEIFLAKNVTTKYHHDSQFKTDDDKSYTQHTCDLHFIILSQWRML